jgi:hypothetical protein
MTYMSEADQAEVDVLLHELVERFWAHRPNCLTCWLGDGFCEPMRECLQIVIDFRDGLRLRAKARELRRLEQRHYFLGVNGAH